MPYFSEETLEAVRSIPLYEIVRTRVELSRSGKNWRGLSPFSNEKTPSFFVISDRNFYKCHSSGMAGDGIKFIQETERLNFQESVEALAERFNIAVTYASGSGPDPEVRSLKQAILDIHDYAREYYHQAFLADNKDGEWIRNYWTVNRGFTLELAKEFQIGFSPPADRGLLAMLSRKNFPTEALAKSGLFHPGRAEHDLDSWYFTFRGRLMVPIRNPQGQVIAFTARQLDVTPKDHASWKAKYINSPETLIFKKGKLLFNMERAKEAVREAGSLLLVEGQLDALRCWDSGLKATVAPQGTSMTEDQMDLAKRYTDILDVFLDSDQAGAKAVLRLLPMALKSRLQVRIISLPQGQDPDDFLRAGGMEAMQTLERQSGISFAARALMGDDPVSPEQKANALQGLFEMIAQCPSAVAREGYFEEAVSSTGVSRSAAYEDYRRFSNRQMAQEQVAQERKVAAKGTNASETLTNLEGDLLWIVLKKLEWAESLEQVIDHNWIRSTTYEGRILSLILAQATVDQIEKANQIYFLLETDEERDCFNHYVNDQREIPDLAAFVQQTLIAIVNRHFKQQTDSLDQQLLQVTQSTTEPTEFRTLLLKKKELKQEKADTSRGILESLQLG